ncbi:beta-mannosidase-like [Hydractinia symbiolongicarpus]|uniref:beta-mannosidase-like n=1 Tax=Hydractinia symbiolongicarpus TaxID=13093 RepID=UPI00254E54C9|nr:beta-mannosidase-like [Hydractinia symbiolongicarpus]
MNLLFVSLRSFMFFCLHKHLAVCNEKINLSDNAWSINCYGLNISIPANVPGSVYTALIDNEIIKDPYFGKRDDTYAWIADKSWSYRTEFKVIRSNLKKHSRIVFYGVDTVADILLNKNLLGKTDNMFSTYSFYITPYLKEENFLEIHFTSPTLYAKNRSENYYLKHGYNVPPQFLPKVQHGRNHQNFIRKEQCSFSWDWGPSFPTIGIWKDVVLEFAEEVVLDDMLVHTIYHNDKQIWNVMFEVTMESYIDEEMVFSYGFDVFKQTQKIKVKTGVQKITLDIMSIPKYMISLWWPNGYGNQTLYRASIVVIHPYNLHSVWNDKKFGFRTVELVQEPIEHSNGLSFYFKINGRPIFLKGANWIPADAFQERVSFVVLENLFKSSVDANINTLRVWGGGVYEQERFYELADELGIVIWQDLMFAVALYPVNEKFLESVQKEIITQVRRLQHHPSIIAWSGNNENEAAIAQTWWDGVKTNRKQLVKDYVKLYVETIEPIIKREDWTRPFITSSPSNGLESKKVGYIAKDPQNPLYGDVHFYDYGNDCWNSSMFPNPRFASEYGYQSYPSFITMSQVATTDDLKWNSSLMFHRQHHANGNEEMENFIKLHYNLPTLSNEQQYFWYMIYLSQIVQATCVKYESEHYRRLQGNLVNGTGHTMGALYWQLNDIWQAPSWSSIEYGGRWKMLHYYAQQFFKPVSITGHVENGKLKVYRVTDHPSDALNLVLSVKVYKWDDFDVIWMKNADVVESEKASMLIFEDDVESLCNDLKCFVKLQLRYQNKEDIISESDVFLSSFSKLTLNDPNIKIVSLSQLTKLEYKINLKCDYPAAFVWLETTVGGRFSNNGFIMAEQNTSVVFYGWKNSFVSVNTLASTIKVISLYDAYRSDV